MANLLFHLLMAVVYIAVFRDGLRAPAAWMRRWGAAALGPRARALGPGPRPVHVQVDDAHVQVRVDDVHVQVQVDDVQVQVGR